MHFRRALLLIALLLACTPKSADTNGDAGSSSAATEGAGTTSATGSTPTTSATTTGDDPTTAGPTSPATIPTSADDTAGSSSASASTDTGDETGGHPGGLPGACMAVCMHWDTCKPGSAGPVDECVKNCTAGVEIPSPCAMASADLANCVAALPCEEALKYVEDGEPPTSCPEEQQAADMICEGPPECGGEITGGGDFCEFEQECDGLKQNIRCELDSGLCTCTENDVVVKDCPEAGFCALDHDAQFAAVEACCGWTWM